MGDSVVSAFARIRHAALSLFIAEESLQATQLRSALCVVLGAAFISSAFAQAPPDSGRLLEGIKREMKPDVSAPQTGGDVLPRAPEPRPALGAPGLKLVVSAFRVTGNTIYPENVLLDQVKEFVGKEQTIDGLNDAATKVRAYYRERGYFLVQAYLPQQEIKGGVIEIAVIEARIGKVAVDIKEGTRFSENMIRGIVEKHLKEGDIITEAGLETPLLLLNDLPNSTVTSEIKPSQTIGSADLVVKVSDSPDLLSGSVDADTYGNRFTGTNRAGFSTTASNPLSLGDQFTVRYFTSGQPMNGLGGGGFMTFFRAAYVLPVGYWGTRIGVSYAQFKYGLGKDFASSQSHGEGSVDTIYAFHPILRTRGANLIAQVAYESKQLDDRVDSTGSVLDRFIKASKIGVVGDARDGFLGGGLNSFSYTIAEGNAIINQATALAADVTSGLNSAGRFEKQNYEYRRLQKITDNSNFLFSLQGQIASKNLMSAEQFSLGGPTGVRAYPVGEALGDQGYVIQADYRYIVPGFKLANGDVTLSAFWDQGYARIHVNPLAPTGNVLNDQNIRHISGYGIGASLGRESVYDLRVYAAWRNENEIPQSDAALRIPQLWFQGIKWF